MDDVVESEVAWSDGSEEEDEASKFLSRQSEILKPKIIYLNIY